VLVKRERVPVEVAVEMAEEVPEEVAVEMADAPERRVELRLAPGRVRVAPAEELERRAR
jgi:hypothetical protein